MKYTSTILAALATSALAYKPAEPVCSAVAVTKYGSYVWVPTPGVWGDVPAPASSTTKDPWADVPAESTTTKDPWADVPAESTTTSKDPWEDVPAESTTTTTTTSKDPWGDVPAPTSTTTSTTTKPHGPKTTTTTTEDKPHPSKTTTVKTTTTTTTVVNKPKATCAADNGKTVLAGGSCGCGFQINCGVFTKPTADSKFWQRKEGEKIATLAECNAICDANDKCTATLWVDDVANGDYHLCFQTSGLPAPAGQGAAQISYKGSCSGKCTQSYNVNSK